ncbi:hypothetical protein D3C76_1532620 [compost metagenome]
MQVHPQLAFGRHAAKRQFGFFKFRQQLHAAWVIGFPIEGRAHLAGTALQQANAQPGFELIEGVGQRGPWHVQVFSGQGETASLVDAHEHLHRFDLIHLNPAPLLLVIVEQSRQLSGIYRRE